MTHLPGDAPLSVVTRRLVRVILLSVLAPACGASDSPGPGPGAIDARPGPTPAPAPAPAADAGRGSVPVDGGGGGGGGGDAAAPAATGPCQVQRATPPDEGGAHVELCAAVSFMSKPPASGAHYPSWPVFRTYAAPVPWGFVVHGMEHGAVVLAYNCPGGCPQEVAAATAAIAKVPVKPGCGRAPVIMMPDPTLDTRWAAAAWGHTLRATCFDSERFAAFIAERSDKGPESFPTDCGLVDLESTGWCP